MRQTEKILDVSQTSSVETTVPKKGTPGTK